MKDKALAAADGPRRSTLDNVAPAQVAMVLERGYEGYAVPVRFTAEALLRRVRSEHIDLACSYMFFDGGDEACGCMLIARRGDHVRIAALGMAPSARGAGYGRQAVQLALSDARARGDRRVVLEVLSSNTGAHRLYRQCGFVDRRMLVGYERPPQPASGDTAMAVPCAPERALERLLRCYPGDVSWQAAPQSFAGSVPPVQAFLSDEGAAAIVEPAGRAMRLLALAVPGDRRRQGLATRFLLSLANRFAGAGWMIPAIVPATLAAEFLVAAGWRQTPLTQVEMEAAP